jgi:outer membrane protein assembly factor BamB
LAWNYTTSANIWDPSPAVADGKVYMRCNDGNFWCLNAANGALIWKYKTGILIGASAAVANGVVYVTSLDRKIYAFIAGPPIPEG